MNSGKKVVITYGTFDLLHHGHVALLERAKALGDYLIVGVTSDAFDQERGKLNVCQSLSDRLTAVKDTGIADSVIVEEYRGQKISDIREFGVDIFAIGSDWEGKFDYLKQYCDVVYLPRTQGISSTELRASRQDDIALGCIGIDYISERLIKESQHVAGMECCSVFPLEGQSMEGMEVCRSSKIYDNLIDLFSAVDAVYINVPIKWRSHYVRAALESDCHVICESPLFLSRAEGEELLSLASSRGLVLMEALKTLYFPAFQHLKLMLESGAIGEIKDIRASFSHVFDGLDYEDRYQGSFFDMASYILLPAIALLGDDYLDATLTCGYVGDFCNWAKCDLLYDTASASLSVGRGMKTEGDMVITGTNGYIYVPSPWWKTDYFELRFEDPRENKKYFYDYAGDGQRYELFEFARLINFAKQGYSPMQSEDDVLAVCDLVEKFDKGDVRVLRPGKYTFGGGEKVNDR